MRDHSQADLCPTAEVDPVADSPAMADTTWDAVSERLDQLLPCLTSIGTRVAILAPALIGIISTNGYGRGVKC